MIDRGMEHPEFGEKCVDHIHRRRGEVNTNIWQGKGGGRKEEAGPLLKPFLPVLQRISPISVLHPQL